MDDTSGKQEEKFPQEGFELTSQKRALEEFCGYTHCAHALVHATGKGMRPLFDDDQYFSPTLVLMQLRFDGTFGFPGGIVDPGETPLQAVNRELQEELDYPADPEIAVKTEDHISTHLFHKQYKVLHFYGREVSQEVFRDLELRACKGRDWGVETMGIVRVPLYEYGNQRGFADFLKNNFIGNARGQLLTALAARELVDLPFLEAAVAAARAKSCICSV